MAELTVRPFLMFEGRASEALEFYVSLFRKAQVVEVERYGPGELGAEGSIKRAQFTIGDQAMMCIDSPVKHAFSFTPSVSFFVECASEAELSGLVTALKAGGAELMPLADYGFSRLFAWVNDRFGVSWQLNLA